MVLISFIDCVVNVHHAYLFLCLFAPVPGCPCAYLLLSIYLLLCLFVPVPSYCFAYLLLRPFASVPTCACAYLLLPSPLPPPLRLVDRVPDCY